MKLLLLALVGLSGTSLALAAPPSQVADAPYPSELRTRVQKAIQKGLEQVRTFGVPNVTRPEAGGTEYRLDILEASQIAGTLRRAGLEADPVHAASVAVLRSHPPLRADDACGVLLALCTESVSSGAPLAADGTLVEPTPRDLDDADRDLARRAVKLLLDAQIQKPMAEAGDELDGTGGWAAPIGDVALDLASLDQTDLAVEALEAAARCGIEVPSGAFSGALRFFLRRQQPKGPAVTLKGNEVRGKVRLEWTESAQARGFDEEAESDRATGSATAACAAGLVVCQDALQSDEGFTPELRLATRTAIRDALAWLQQHFDAAKNPVVGKPLEDAADTIDDWRQALLRLAVHARLRFLGSRDGYAELAKSVLKAQKADGTFGSSTSDTCGALRILMRASLASKARALAEPEAPAPK